MHPLEFTSQDIPDLVSLRIVIVNTFLPLFQVILVVSTVDVHLAMIQFHHYVCHAVQEIAVVGNHQEGASGMGKIILKEFDGIDVKMVGGLIHHIEISIAGQHDHQGNPLDFPARKILHQAGRIHHSERVKQLPDTEFIRCKMFRVKMFSPFCAV